MAESNPTQVILTDDGLKIINAQTTADNAASEVTNLNDSSKLGPAEKQALSRKYQADKALYSIDIKMLTDAGLPTTDLQSAMTALDSFITPYFQDMGKTEQVSRDRLNQVFTGFDTADKNANSAFNDMVSNAANDAKKAGDDAKVAGEQAQAVGEEAKQAASQAQADASQAKSDAATAQQKAQSSIDQLNAHLPDIDKALSAANLVKQDVTKLSDITEQYHNEYTTGIQNVVKTIDGITIGGTNLVPNSGYPTGTEHWTAGGASNTFRVTKHAFYHNGADNTFNFINHGKQAGSECYASSERFPVKPNTQYSLSFKGFASSNLPSMDVWFFGRKYNSTASTGYDKAILIVNKKVLSPSQVDTVQAVFNTGDCEEGYLRFDNNGSLDGKDSSLYFTEIKVEQGNKATDWSLSPSDTATSTEIDQINNAIKLKANSSDVTSQINVATQGIQTDVTNKVSNLTTQINQTSDAVQILATTGGQKNLVYNSSYANNAEGWNMFNQTGYLSSLAVSSYNGSPGFGVNVSGKDTSTWTRFGSSKYYQLPQPDAVAVENTYSASAVIKIYSDSDKGAQLSATVTYCDKNGTRLAWQDMKVDYSFKDVWKQVKFEDFKVPKGAYSISMNFWAYGSKVHGMIAQPMIVFGPKIGTYNPDTVSQSDITASINNIHMGIKGADGSTSTFNMNNNTILLDANKIIINGNTSIQNGTIGTAKIANAAINTAQIADGAINNAKIANAAINDAKIANLNGNKIIAGSITSQQLNADDIIANVINGKTINGITINTPNLNLGTNGVLNEDWNLNQNTGWFQPKKGTGTTTLDTGVLRMSGNLSRWWDGNGSDQYWYGIGDNGDKIKNGSNSVTDDYAPGYEKHDIVGSSGVLLRSYLDATGLYLNQNSTKTVMVALTQKGLDTGGYIHAQQNSVVDKWFDAGVDTGTGIRIGYRAIQVHGSNDIYFNTDSTVGALTLHAKNFAASSQLSKKKDISPLEEEQAMETIMNTDIYRYHYKDETESEPYNYSVIIDDIHEKSQYKTPEEFIIADRTGRNDGNAVGFLIQALKNANRRISALEEIINERK